MSMSNPPSKIRLDKWLWAARFYKTRNIAKAAIEGNKVYVNGHRCKAGKEPKVGDAIRFRAGHDEKTVIVHALCDKWQSAEIAQTLYQETEESIALREKRMLERKAMGGATPHPENKPDKKDRRKLRELKSY